MWSDIVLVRHKLFLMCTRWSASSQHTDTRKSKRNGMTFLEIAAVIPRAPDRTQRNTYPSRHIQSEPVPLSAAEGHQYLEQQANPQHGINCLVKRHSASHQSRLWRPEAFWIDLAFQGDHPLYVPKAKAIPAPSWPGVSWCPMPRFTSWEGVSEQPNLGASWWFHDLTFHWSPSNLGAERPRISGKIIGNLRWQSQTREG